MGTNFYGQLVTALQNKRNRILCKEHMDSRLCFIFSTKYMSKNFILLQKRYSFKFTL